MTALVPLLTMSATAPAPLPTLPMTALPPRSTAFFRTGGTIAHSMDDGARAAAQGIRHGTGPIADRSGHGLSRTDDGAGTGTHGLGHGRAAARHALGGAPGLSRALSATVPTVSEIFCPMEAGKFTSCLRKASTMAPTVSREISASMVPASRTQACCRASSLPRAAKRKALRVTTPARMTSRQLAARR